MATINGMIERNELRVAEMDKRDARRLEWEQVNLLFFFNIYRLSRENDEIQRR